PSVHTPLLHPFPTRRSSDLATLPRTRRHDAIIAFAKKIQRCAICFERSSCRFQNSDQFQAGTAAGRRLHSAFDAIDKMLALYLQDRKSTRLNSCHEWISYAV